MNNLKTGNKSKKQLLALTILTIISIVSVAVVYAATVGTFTGGEVTIGGEAAGTIEYTSDTVTPTWTTTLAPTSASDDWYSRLDIDGGQYSGQAVTISWKLQRLIDTTWTDVGTPTVTSMSLADGAQFVYATGDGSDTNNRDWSQDITVQGTYRVVASAVTT